VRFYLAYHHKSIKNIIEIYYNETIKAIIQGAFKSQTRHNREITQEVDVLN